MFRKWMDANFRAQKTMHVPCRFCSTREKQATRLSPQGSHRLTLLTEMSSKDVFQLGQYNIRSSGELQPRKIHNMHIYNTVYIYIIYLIISGQSMLWYITGLMDHHFWAKLDDWIVGPTTECRSLSSCPNIAAT